MSSKGKKRHSPSEARFLGNGNVWVGQLRGWKVTCQRCSTSKVITSHGQNSMPPSVILKNLSRAGWKVGNNPKDDLCPDCYRKPIQSTVDLAKKALTLAAAPVVTNGGGTVMHFSELLTLALKLPPEQIKQMIKSLREALPRPIAPERKPKPVQPVAETDAEYARWLEQQG